MGGKSGTTGSRALTQISAHVQMRMTRQVKTQSSACAAVVTQTQYLWYMAGLETLVGILQGPDGLNKEHCKLDGLQEKPGGEAHGAHTAGVEAVSGPRAACGHLWAGAHHPLLLMHAYCQDGLCRLLLFSFTPQETCHLLDGKLSELF